MKKLKLILCKIFGHNFEPETNPIGAIHGDFVFYFRKMKCSRCGCFYKDNYIEPYVTQQ